MPFLTHASISAMAFNASALVMSEVSGGSLGSVPGFGARANNTHCRKYQWQCENEQSFSVKVFFYSTDVFRALSKKKPLRQTKQHEQANLNMKRTPASPASAVLPFNDTSL
jgi:hypothetical protein